MIHRSDLLDYLTTLLEPARYSDYCPNGLQVSGKENVATIVSGVSANLALIQAAIEIKADLLLVHHGYFWKGENPCLVDYKYDRIRLLMMHELNLVAYHLPLDGHEQLGNNAELARILEFTPQGQLSSGERPALTWHGVLNQPMNGLELSQHIAQRLAREPFYVPGRSDSIKTVAWCTGAAQDFILTAVEAGCDAFITGEVSERTVDIARETGIHFYAAGHYATERYGIKALGDHLAKKYNVSHHFIDIDNPI